MVALATIRGTERLHLLSVFFVNFVAHCDEDGDTTVNHVPICSSEADEDNMDDCACDAIVYKDAIDGNAEADDCVDDWACDANKHASAAWQNEMK